MKSLTQITFSNRFLVLSDQAIFSGTSFLVTLLLARMLNTKDFGIFSSIVLFNFLIISITNALVIQPFQVNVARFKESKSYLSFTLLFQFGLSLLVVGVLFYINSFGFFPAIGESFFFISLFTLGFVFHDFFRKSFLAQNRLLQCLCIDGVLAISQFTSLGLIYVDKQNNLDTVVFYQAVSFTPAILLALFYFKLNLNHLKTWSKFLKTHLAEGSWLLMVALLQWGSNNIFIITSGVFIGIEALGALRLVQSLFGVLNILLQTFENYVLPNATRLYQTSVPASKNYLKSISIKASLIFGAILLTLFIFSYEVIVLAGGLKYESYDYLIKGMALLYFILFVGYPIRMSIRMLILNRTFFYGYVFSFLFTLCTYNFLIKEWQLKGVIIGLIINQLLMLIYWHYQLTKNKFYLWK